MCVSTVALCTLATLSTDASPPPLPPPPLDPPPPRDSETKSQPLMTPVISVAPPEVGSIELSAELDDPTPGPGLVPAQGSVAIAPATRSGTDVRSSDAPSAQPSLMVRDWRRLAVAPTPPAIAPPGVLPVADPRPSPEAETVATLSTPEPIYLDSQPEFSRTVADLRGDGDRIAQAVGEIPSDAEIQDLQEALRSFDTEAEEDFGDIYEGSPAISIAIPSGYGADNWEGFVNFSYQTRTRGANQDDATMGIGIGLGDAEEAVGLQLSYTIASFGENRDFGSGGFNAKLHRRLGNGWSAAVGWEGFLNIGDDNDFEDSVYGTITHIARLSPDIEDPFSRIAFTAGVGSGRFRTEEAIQDGDDTLGVFGSVAVRVARPVSAIVEWTGQDLALGLSIAPLPHVPWVITPALRDVAGGGDGARLVIGTGFSWQF